MKNLSRLIDLRKANLRIILERDFDSDRNKLAKTLGKQVTTIASWFSSGNSARPISDKMARSIEVSLELDHGELDHKPRGGKNIYYVMVCISGYRLEDFIKRLRKYSDLVLEVSALFGEMDMFIKIEADESEFQNFILHVVHKFPGVKSTKTFMGLSQPRWQVAQEAIECISDSEPSNVKYIDHFIEQRISYHYKKIDEMDKTGAILLDKNDPVPISYMEIIQEIKQGLRTTYRWLKESREKSAIHSDILSLIKNKISQGLVSRRIILLEDKVEQHHVAAIKADISKYQNIGCKVRVLFEKEWIPTPNHPGAEGFNIFDDQLLTIQKRQYTHIHYHDRTILNYIDTFENNWGRAKEGEQMKMILKAI